jgi:hypothetical protein
MVLADPLAGKKRKRKGGGGVGWKETYVIVKAERDDLKEKSGKATSENSMHGTL